MRVLVIDNGLNTEIAYRLGKSRLFDKVAYYSPWQADFVATRERAVGTGFDEYERIYDVSRKTLEQYDGFVFPDLYHKDLAMSLRDEGVGVWGAFGLEDLELDRVALLEIMQDAEMNLPHYTICEGVDHALAVAKDGDFIKITGYSRGDTETSRHDAASPVWAEKLKMRLGPLAKKIPIIVQRPIKDDVEGGYDQIFVEGTLCYPFLFGYEMKDTAYLGHVTDKLPPQLAAEAKKIEYFLEGTSYTNFLSTEFRGNILIDITTRMPSPPGDIHLALWRNLPRVIYYALNDNFEGSLIADYEYAVELIVKSSEPTDFVWFDIPRDYRDRIGIRRAFKQDGLIWSAPSRDDSLGEIAGIVGFGSSPEDAMNDAKAVSKAIKMSHNLDCYPDAARELLKTAEKGEKEGIPF